MAKKPISIRRAPYSSLRYNAKAARYIGTNGRFLSPKTVDKIIIGDLDAARVRMERISSNFAQTAEMYTGGQIGKQQYLEAVESWRNQMGVQIKALHMGNVAAGKGGFHNLTNADFGRAGSLLKKQYKFLSDFALEVAKDPAIATSQAAGRMGFAKRVGLYADAGRGTFFVIQHQAHRDAGFKKVLNVLDPNPEVEHCDHPLNGCIQITALGKVDIDDVRFLLPGFRFCQVNDRCTLIYSMA